VLGKRSRFQLFYNGQLSGNRPFKRKVNKRLAVMPEQEQIKAKHLRRKVKLYLSADKQSGDSLLRIIALREGRLSLGNAQLNGNSAY
jgi:hypothetical protein